MSNIPKFRIWDKEFKMMRHVSSIDFDDKCTYSDYPDMHVCCERKFHEVELMQWTGFKDKSGLHELYEGDIIDEHGNLAGNIYEDIDLHAQDSNCTIAKMGCETWANTHKEIIKRGCQYAK